MATITAFQDARRLYREYVNYTQPLSFEEWMSRSSDQKAAILFVQFYNEITLAWSKANTFDFITSEEGVSTMCQYLQKNVPVIENQPKRFSAAYIYKVAYNCLYCICHDRKCDKDRWDYETSSIVVSGDTEYDLFDTISDKNGTPDDALNKKAFEDEFWSIIKDLGQSAEKVLRYLSTGDEKDLKKVNPRAKDYKTDPLRDVEVTKEQADSIITELRKRFLNLSTSSNCGQYIAKFSCFN